MIRVFLHLRDHRDVRFIVYGKDYEDIKKQAKKFEKDWKNADKKANYKVPEILFDQSRERAFD